jgi:hypothetical protein
VYVFGLAHDACVPLSSLHWNVTPLCDSLNANVAVVELDGFAGAEVIVGGGSVGAAGAPPTTSSSPPASPRRTASEASRRGLLLLAVLILRLRIE